MGDGGRCLFVYGTLMTWASGAYGRAERERLSLEVTSRGPATMAGRLWDLGSFPGLKDSSEFGDVVHGEVLELMSPEQSFAWLDAYEGIGGGAPAANVYERVARAARLATGEDVTAWVYLYRHSVAQARWIPAGRWSASA